LAHIERFIAPKTEKSVDDAKQDYDNHLEKFKEEDDIYKWFEKLEEYQRIRLHFDNGARTATAAAAMADAKRIITRKCGAEGSLPTQLAVKKATVDIKVSTGEMQPQTENEQVAEFKIFLRIFQQERAPTHKGLKSDIECAWCFEHKGRKFPHDVKDCISKKNAEKKKTEGNTGTKSNTGAAGGTASKECYLCKQEGHMSFPSRCPATH
jgi:hypothetical protein